MPSLRRDGDETSDQDLVARVRAGDDRAFERLYRRYHRRIASYIQGMVHDHARAEDITQDVFMSALRRMRETERPIAFKPWIYEIAKNACIDQFRRSRRAEEVSYDAEDGLGSADYGKLITKDPGPDVAVENKQSLDHLRGAFGGLSETHHEILVMRELEGLSYRQIGERLGMTRPAVESTLFRARRRLTEEYEQLVTGERCQRVQSIIDLAQAGALGARDRRRLARHVSYCQPCLRHARVSGIDSADLVHTPVRAKIAALLPLPAFLKRKLAGGDPEVPAPDMGSSLAMWSAQAGTVDPGVVSSWGKAAATAATIAIAGVGAGAATNPTSDARAALDGGSVLERITRESDPRGTTGRAAISAPASVVPSSAAAIPRVGTAAAGATAVTGTRAAGSSSRDRDGAGSGSSSSGGSSSSSGSGSSGSSTSPTTTGATPVAAAPEETTRQATETTESTAGSNPLRETVERLTGTGGGSGSSSGSTSGSTSSGGGSTSGDARAPSIQLPTLTPPSGDATTSGSTAPVQETVEKTAQAVQETVDTVDDAVTGLLGGK